MKMNYNSPIGSYVKSKVLYTLLIPFLLICSCGYDLNNDGYKDKIKVTEDGVGKTINVGIRLEGKGSHRFKKTAEIPIDPRAEDVETGDLNGDGNLDIVFKLPCDADSRYYYRCMIPGNGDGTFEVEEIQHCKCRKIGLY